MRRSLLPLVVFLSVLAVPADPQPPAPAPGQVRLRIDRDVEYARVGNRPLRLDLYLREAFTEPAPVVVWIHGGGWSMGDKFPTPAARLVAAGYAVASVEYRLTGEAKFPAQIHDCKAAIRWLRANARKYNLDSTHIGVWGHSSGGHLVSLLGTSGHVKELEGDEGNLDQSSRVQAVVDFSGPADLLRTDPSGAKPKDNDGYRAFIGGPLLDHQDIAKAASPLTYVSSDNPPFLIVHGTADRTVMPRQGEWFVAALKHAGVDATLEYVAGAGHDMKQVQTAAIAEEVTGFFDKHLRDGKRTRDDANYVVEPPDCWQDPFTDEIGGLPYKTYPQPSRGPKMQGSYRLYLPPDYEANAGRRFPVIYWLHGASGDSRQAINHGWAPRLDAAIRNGIAPPIIAILVESPNLSGYVDSKDGKIPVETVIVKDLIAHVDSTYRTIATREGRAIDGQSMGGAGSLRIGFHHPELFGTVSSTAAGIVDSSQQARNAANNERFRIMYSGDMDYYQSSTAWAIVETNADKIRGRTNIRMIVGDNDGLMARNQWFHELLTRLKIQHEFVISKGAIHNLREELSRLDSNPFEFYARAFAAAK
jgi:acetyl esterase/lipase